MSKEHEIIEDIAKILQPKNTKGDVDYSNIKNTFCAQNKYLEELGLSQKDYDYYLDLDKNDNRWPIWDKERKEYGGATSIESWDYGLSILPIYLYTRLKMYLENAGQMVNLEYHSFEIDFIEEKENLITKEDGSTKLEKKKEIVTKTYTEKEALEEIIKIFEEYIVYTYKTERELLLSDKFSSENIKDKNKYFNKTFRKAFILLGNIWYTLWW